MKKFLFDVIIVGRRFPPLPSNLAVGLTDCTNISIPIKQSDWFVLRSCEHYIRHTPREKWPTAATSRRVDTRNVSEDFQKQLLCPGHKLCVRHRCCTRGKTSQHLGNMITSAMLPPQFVILLPAPNTRARTEVASKPSPSRWAACWRVRWPWVPGQSRSRCYGSCTASPRWCPAAEAPW